MDKNKGRRLIELGKDVLIVLLACSAIYLTYHTLLVSGLEDFWKGESSSTGNVVKEREESSVAWPVRMAVSSWDGESLSRYGVQYNAGDCDEQFRLVASLLREALSSLGPAREVSRYEWRSALSGTTNLYFDFLGGIPLSVLSGWLSGTDNGLSDPVRRLALSAKEKQVIIYYRDESTGKYYARTAEVVNTQQLSSATRSVTGNGAIFAFEQEQYSGLDGDTMILSKPPQPEVYSAVNPLAGESQMEELNQSSRLGELLTAISFPDNSYIYYNNVMVIRSGNDTVRISDDGVVRYEMLEGERSRYQVSAKGEQPTLLEAAQACRWLAEGTVGAMAGEGRLYLREIRQTEKGWQIQFGYCLNGTEVQVGAAGYAAQFQVEGNEITQFILQLRSYSAAGSQSIVLPEQQAMAAMQALDKQGGELMLSYRDMGADTVSAGWITD